MTNQLTSTFRFRDTLYYPVTYVDWQETGVNVLSAPKNLNWICDQANDIAVPIKGSANTGITDPIGWLDWNPNLKLGATNKVSTGIPTKTKLTVTVFMKKIDPQNYNYDGSESISLAKTNAFNNGVGYKVGDILSVDNPNNRIYPALVQVIEAPGGIINMFQVIQPGYGYSAGLYNLVGGSGVGATIQLLSTDLTVFEPINYQWSIKIDEQRFFLALDYDDVNGTWFKEIVIDLERFDTNFVPKFGMFVDLNSNSNFVSSPLVSEPVFLTPQWYFTLPRYSDFFFNYIVEYQPNEIDHGDVQETPITMPAIARLLTQRDKKRDLLKNKPWTTRKETMGNRADLRRRQEINRPMTNAPR